MGSCAPPAKIRRNPSRPRIELDEWRRPVGADELRSRGDAQASKGLRAPPIETASPGRYLLHRKEETGAVARPRAAEALVYFAGTLALTLNPGRPRPVARDREQPRLARRLLVRAELAGEVGERRRRGG